MKDSTRTAILRAMTERGIPVFAGEPLKPYTTFRIGGPAALLARPSDRAMLTAALDIWRTYGDGCPLCVLGRGSNVLAADSGFDGLVIVTSGVKHSTVSPDGTVTADCGTPLTALAADCAAPLPAPGADGRERALSGLEFAYGIPGTVGGAVVMNAGAYGGEMSRVVVQSEYYNLTDGSLHTVTGDAHEFAYRHSLYSLHPDYIVLGAVLSLTPADPAAVRALMDKNMAARREKQPLSFPSAGSVFKRPAAPGVYVGKMVEDCGLKGYSVGGAQVSVLHGGFIVNTGDAACRDVLAVIDHVRRVVRERCGVNLECEIRCIGED